MLFGKKRENKESINTEISVRSGNIANNTDISNLITKQNYQNLLAERVFKEAEETLEVAEMLLKSVEDINIEMDKHTEQIKKTVEVSTEVSAFSQEVNANVDETMKVIDDTLNRAQIGQQSVNEVIGSIETVHETVSNMKAVLAELDDKSNMIKSIVDTIKGIAKTTHLLALNANIEAARAGESGKGFAVVAGEVKKLAENSSKSADEIDAIIHQITKVTEDTMAIILTGVSKVVESTSIAENAGRAIDDMMTSVERTRNISYEISKVVKEQSDKNQYLISVIEDMVEAAEKVRVFNENISVNADRQKASLSTLKSTIGNLNIMSEIDEKSEFIVPKSFAMSASKPQTMDPSMATDINTSNILTPINLGLVQFGSGIEVIGAIARSWHLESDNVTWEFNLRRDMKFHNGRIITAKDIKYSYERLLSREHNSPNRWFLSMIKGAEEYYSGLTREVEGITIKNDFTIRITLENPYSSFVSNLAHCSCSIVPKEEISTINSIPIGAGPYKVKELDSDKNLIIYEKFKDFSLGSALVDSIIIDNNTGDSTDRFLRGELDYLEVNGVNREQLINSGYRIDTTECIGSRFLPFNFRSNNPLVTTKEVRQAINYCIDKERIIREGLGGFATLAKGVFPSTILNNPRLNGYSRNLSRAKELMKKSGINGGILTLQMTPNEKKVGFHYVVTDVLRENLKELGIELRIIEAPSGKYYDQEYLSKSDIMIYGWLGDSGTADNFIEPLIDINNPSNRNKYNNPELIVLLEESKKIKNPYKYRETLMKLENKMLEDAPWVFLCNINVTYSYGKGIKGLKVHPLNIIKFADMWKE